MCKIKATEWSSRGERSYLDVVLSSDCQVILSKKMNRHKHSQLSASVKMVNSSGSNLLDKVSLSPGMINQGDMVGNRKGLFLIVTQNGEMLPCGIPHFIGGKVTPATTLSLSSRAFSSSLGAAQTKHKQSVKVNIFKSDKRVWEVKKLKKGDSWLRPGYLSSCETKITER